MGSASAISDHADLPRLLVTEREAARILCLDPRTLRRLRAKGEIACIRVGASDAGGRAVRYDPRDLVAWVDAKKAQSSAHSAATGMDTA